MHGVTAVNNTFLARVRLPDSLMTRVAGWEILHENVDCAWLACAFGASCSPCSPCLRSLGPFIFFSICAGPSPSQSRYVILHSVGASGSLCHGILSGIECTVVPRFCPLAQRAQVKTFEVGMWIDVRSARTQSWCPARVNVVEAKRIKVHFYRCPKKLDEWVSTVSRTSGELDGHGFSAEGRVRRSRLVVVIALRRSVSW